MNFYYYRLNLLPLYKKVKDHFKKSSRTCVIHPTGTGKSFIAKQLLKETNEPCLFLTSYVFIAEEMAFSLKQDGMENTTCIT